MRPLLHLAGILVVLAAADIAQPAAGPDLVLLNARVYAAEAAHPWAEAVTISGDRITAVGITAEISVLARTVATDFTLSYPERVDRLVLVSSGLGGPLFATGMAQPCYAAAARQMLDEHWSALRMLPLLIESGEMPSTKIPSATTVTFPNVSHHLNMEIAQDFTQLISDFLGR